VLHCVSLIIKIVALGIYEYDSDILHHNT